MIHGSGIDSLLGPKLLETMGSPYKQKGNKFSGKGYAKDDISSMKGYMNKAEEAYGNFHGYRIDLDLKPGEKVTKEQLIKRTKDKGLENSNFYQTFDDDNIVKAINTIAQNKGKKKEPTYAKNGGLVQKYDDGGYIKPEWMNDPYLQPGTNPRYSGEGTLSDDELTKSIASEYTQTNPLKNSSGYPYLDKIKSAAGQAGNWLGENKNDLMRAYPILSNIIEKDRIKKPVGTYSARLNDSFQAPDVDEARMMRDINAAYGNKYRALGQMGGSQAQQRAMLLGLGTQQNQAISQAQQGIEEVRANRSLQEQQFKSQVAQYNAGKSDYDRETYDKDIANYDTQRSKFSSQISEDIGKVALEQDRMDQVANMYGYDRKGKYLINRKTGKVATPDEVAKIKSVTDEKTPTLKPGDKYINSEGKEVTVSAYGGFLKNRRYGQ
jgi:hypothetical protein